MFDRLFFRTMIFAVLTVLAFVCVELCTEAARHRFIIVGEMLPEILRFLIAVAVMAWLELSTMWIRVCMHPKLDMQEVMSKATEQDACSVLHAIQLAWVVRLIVFLILYMGQ